MNVINRLPIVLALVGLAACAESAPYPTEARVAGFADGHRVVVFGSTIHAACSAIADRACDGGACRDRVIDRCEPIGGGRVEAASHELWDAMWWDCLDQIDDQPGPYLGTTRPPACARLTPYWRPRPVAP